MDGNLDFIRCVINYTDYIELNKNLGLYRNVKDSKTDRQNYERYVRGNFELCRKGGRRWYINYVM